MLQKNKKITLRRLSRLYLYFYLSLPSLIFLIIAFIFVVFIFLLNAQLNCSELNYLLNKEEIIQSYFQENFFVTSIINVIVVIVVASLEITSATNNFDFIFIPRCSKVKILFSKLIALLKIIVTFLIMEFLFLVTIPSIFYPDYLFEIQQLSLLLCFVLQAIFFLIISLILIVRFESIIASLVVFIFCIGIKMFYDTGTITQQNLVDYFCPQYIYDASLNICKFKYGFYYVGSLCNIVFFILVYVYQKKRYKNL